AVLTGEPRAHDEDEALAQAARWSEATGVAVVVKTGHLDSREVTNTWIGTDGTRHPVHSTRVDTTSTHGTGCSLAAALATRPVDHAHRARRLAAAGSAAPWVAGGAVPDRWEQPAQLAARATADGPTGPAASVPPVGPWTEALWAAGAPLAGAIEGSGFVAALV